MINFLLHQTEQLWVRILRQKTSISVALYLPGAWWAASCLERWAARVYNLEANDNAEGWFIKLSYPKHPAHYDFRRRHLASSERITFTTSTLQMIFIDSLNNNDPVFVIIQITHGQWFINNIDFPRRYEYLKHMSACCIVWEERSGSLKEELIIHFKLIRIAINQRRDYHLNQFLTEFQVSLSLTRKKPCFCPMLLLWILSVYTKHWDSPTMALEKCTFHRIKRAKADLENSIFNDNNKKTTQEPRETLLKLELLNLFSVLFCQECLLSSSSF